MEFKSQGASHHGGVWKRQIKPNKQLLFSVLKQLELTEEGLHMLFCEEAILNSCPLTTVSNDHRDLEPLTLNHILLLKSPPIIPVTKRPVTKICLLLANTE